MREGTKKKEDVEAEKKKLLYKFPLIHTEGFLSNPAPTAPTSHK